MQGALTYDLSIRNNEYISSPVPPPMTIPVYATACTYVVDCVQKKKPQYRHKYISNTTNSVYNILI